eukprot:6653584-Prymnesium_polylepis.1
MRVMHTGLYRDYAMMSKPAYNDYIGQKVLWATGEREALLQRLCARADASGAARVWITSDYFLQHTDKHAGEVQVRAPRHRVHLVHLVHRVHRVHRVHLVCTLCTLCTLCTVRTLSLCLVCERERVSCVCECV